MGIFDFFKKKLPESKKAEERDTIHPVDNNAYVLEILKDRLTGLGYNIKRHPQYLALIVKDELEIATVIIDNPCNHPAIFHLGTLTTHPAYFPNGIQENIIGVGTTMQEKVRTVIDNYINTTFLSIIDSFSERHNPELDFFSKINGKDILWHPALGNLAFQGDWGQQPPNELLFEIVKDKLKSKLTSNKLHWLKLYISKQADGTITGECLLNNESWDEGLADITEYAKSWEMKSNFRGIKQFSMFRRCDAYDEV